MSPSSSPSSSAPSPTLSSKPSILVLGAGELGLPVLQALSSHPLSPGSKITVLLRPSTITTNTTLTTLLSSLNIEILPGDIHASTASQLANLFQPFSVIVGCVGMSSPAGTQRKICEAVLLSAKQQQQSHKAQQNENRKRYFPWQFGVDYDVIGKGSSQDLFTEQLAVREMLRGQKNGEVVDWVVVSTGMFTSFLFERVFGVVVPIELENAENTEGEEGEKRGWVVNALGSWDNAITVTSPPDIGKVVAELVYAAPEIQGVVYTAGDTVTFGKLADVLERVSGRMVQRRLSTVEELKRELAEDPGDGMKKYRAVFAEGRGVSWGMEETVNWRRGMRLQGVEEWVKGNLHV